MDFIYNPKFEAENESETIETFGETPVPEVQKKELSDAEDEIKDTEEERADKNSDDEADVDDMDDEAIMKHRFIPKLSTSEVIGDAPETSVCPSCADAGDVAIIDAEVSPADEEDTGAGDDGNNLGEGTGVGPELKAYALYKKQLRSQTDLTMKYDPDAFIAGLEDLGSIFSAIKGLLGSLTVKIAKYTRRVYMFSRKKIMSTFMRLQTVQAFYERKLIKHINDVDVERLNSSEIEAWPYETWVEAAKIALMSFEMVNTAERIVFEPGEEATTNTIKMLRERLERLGINVNLSSNRIVMDELLDKRRYQSIQDHGYTKSQIQNCMRYFKDISKRVPKGDDNHLESIINNVTKKVTSRATDINGALEEGRLHKGSPEYQAEVDKLFNFTVRLDFCLTLMRLAYTLFDKLSADMQKVCGKYEDAMIDEKYL